MTERPILFSAPMVRAILAGTKTQTRRVVKGQALNWLRPDGFTPKFVALPENSLCPYGQPGDRLWVRETWYCDDYRVQRGPYLKPDDLDVREARDDGTLCYAADNRRPYEAEQPVWKPSIHMPRWASRITLEITGVRVERLQAISEADAQAEGINVLPTLKGQACNIDGGSLLAGGPRLAFRDLWQSINGAESWAANPWVWAVEFKRASSEGDKQ